MSVTYFLKEDQRGPASDVLYGCAGDEVRLCSRLEEGQTVAIVQVITRRGDVETYGDKFPVPVRKLFHEPLPEKEPEPIPEPKKLSFDLPPPPPPKPEQGTLF